MIGRRLFGRTRQALLGEDKEGGFGFGGRQMRHISITLFDVAGRALSSLCSGVVFLMIRKDLVISGKKRLLRRRKKL
jgi:hypothetical protein